MINNMSYKVEISDNVDENEWNDNLINNPSSMVYQTTTWLKLYQITYGSKPIFITIRDQNKKIVGQLACLIHRKVFWQDANPLSKIIGNMLKLGTVLWWYHGPIIHDKSNKDEILNTILHSLEKVVQKNKVIMIRGISPPLEEQFPSEIFLKNGYKLVPRLTFIIDLRHNLTELYDSLKKDTRYYIRKSEKEDFQFEVAEDKEAMVKFQDLKYQAKKREGKKALKNPDFFDKHWEIMRGEGREHLLIARHKGEIIGAILTLVFNGNMIQHALANSPDKELIGTFLTWNTLKWAQKMKYLTFDFAGVDPNPQTKKEKGIYFYAEKFGGKKYDYWVYTKIIDRTKYYLSSGLKNPNRIITKS